MNILLFALTVSILALFYTILGFIASRSVSSTTDYFLAGRDLGLAPVTFTLIATQLGGAMLLGTSQEAYSVGLYGILYTLGMALGFLLLASGIAQKQQQLNVATTAELFETHYKSPALKTFASLLSIITLCGILVAQIVGAKSIIATMGVQSDIFFIAFWLLIVAYTMIGGLKAVVITDTAQVLYIIAIFFGIFFYCLWQDPSFINPWHLIDLQTQFKTSSLSISQLLAIGLMPALFALIEQDLAQRFFAARTPRIAMLAAAIAGVFLLLFSFIPIYFGMQAKLLSLALADGASPLIPTIEQLTNQTIVVFATCGVLAAITSTADSLLCAVSSNIAQDFDYSWLAHHKGIKHSQAITLIVGIITLLASYLVPANIIRIVIGSYELSVNCLLAPLLVAYFTRNVKRMAAFAAVLGGLIPFIILPFISHDLYLPHTIIPLVCSFVCYGIGHFYASE